MAAMPWVEMGTRRWPMCCAGRVRSPGKETGSGRSASSAFQAARDILCLGHRFVLPADEIAHGKGWREMGRAVVRQGPKGFGHFMGEDGIAVSIRDTVMSYFDQNP